jgi:hypothetical protein
MKLYVNAGPDQFLSDEIHVTVRVVLPGVCDPDS